MLPILFSDTGATSQDGSHSAIFRMQGPEGCDRTAMLSVLNYNTFSIKSPPIFYGA